MESNSIICLEATCATDRANFLWRGGFTTRHGGVSTGEFASLNLGYHVNDDPQAVSDNRRAVENSLGCEIVWMSQIHSDIWKDTSQAQRTPAGNISVGEADALILEAGDAPESGLGVAVMVADCIPLLLLDKSGARGGVVHVGRAGLDAGIALLVLDEFARRGTDLADVHAVIGPHICGSCYEVPQAMADDVAARWPAARSTTSWGTPAINLESALVDQLASRGVGHISTSEVCTLEDDAFFSHRRSARRGSAAGRFAGVMVLVPSTQV